MAGDSVEDFKLHTEYAIQVGSWRTSIHNEMKNVIMILDLLVSIVID